MDILAWLKDLFCGSNGVDSEFEDENGDSDIMDACCEPECDEDSGLHEPPSQRKTRSFAKQQFDETSVERIEKSKSTHRKLDDLNARLDLKLKEKNGGRYGVC